MSKDLMLLSGGHPVHRRFGDAIGATNLQIQFLSKKAQPTPLKALNLLRSSLAIPSGYDCIVCEACYYYPAIRRSLGLLGKASIVNLNCGPLLNDVLGGKVGGMERRMLLSLIEEVDGHLVYGTYGQEIIKKFKVTAPVGIVYPFIESSSIGRLVRVMPDLTSPVISTIAARGPYNKGLDLAFKAIGIVRKQHPNAIINVVTRMEESEIVTVGGYDPSFVRVSRNVSDISTVFSDSSLYIQPSRGDMFPVSCLESMAAGVPTIVSDENGAKELIGQIDPRMIVKPNEDSLAREILRYFDLSLSQRKDIGSQSRSVASSFDETRMVKRFKNEFERLKNQMRPR